MSFTLWKCTSLSTASVGLILVFFLPEEGGSRCNSSRMDDISLSQSEQVTNTQKTRANLKLYHLQKSYQPFSDPCPTAALTLNFCCQSKRPGFIDDLVLECCLPPLKQLVGFFRIEQKDKVLIYLMLKHISRQIWENLDSKWTVCACENFDRLKKSNFQKMFDIVCNSNYEANYPCEKSTLPTWSALVT